MRPGYAAIGDLAGGELFDAYVRAFPETSHDAGTMLRVAVQTDQVDRYQALLELALIDRRPVGDAQWHGLCAAVSWPRPLPEWDRAPIEQWRLDMNPDATPDWPEAYIGGCQIGHRHPNPWLERRPGLLGWLFHDSPPGKSVPAGHHGAAAPVARASFLTRFRARGERVRARVMGLAWHRRRSRRATAESAT